MLNSNGPAPRTESTYDLMREMHPDFGWATNLPKQKGQPLTLSSEDAVAKLRKAAGTRECSNDVYGWADDYLRPIKGDGKHPLLLQLARLETLLAGPNLPMAVRIILTAGVLGPLNKVTRAENEHRAAQGLSPRCDPPTMGSSSSRTP